MVTRHSRALLLARSRHGTAPPYAPCPRPLLQLPQGTSIQLYERSCLLSGQPSRRSRLRSSAQGANSISFTRLARRRPIHCVTRCGPATAAEMRAWQCLLTSPFVQLSCSQRFMPSNMSEAKLFATRDEEEAQVPERVLPSTLPSAELQWLVNCLRRAADVCCLHPVWVGRPLACNRLAGRGRGCERLRAGDAPSPRMTAHSRA